MSLKLTEHRLREDLVNELRARPYRPLEVPARISHLSMLGSEDSYSEDHEHICKLCRKYNVPPPALGTNHLIADFGAFSLRWERHTEFSSYTFYGKDNSKLDEDDPFRETILDYVPRPWLEATPGRLLSAVHMVFENREKGCATHDRIERLFKGNPYVGSKVQDGAAKAWSDLRLHDDGFTRMLVQDIDLEPKQAGRLCQRLLDIETYRMMALLALPVARATSPRIRAIGSGVAEIATGMAEHSGSSDAALLNHLSQLAAEIEEISASTSYRYGATQAYYNIFKNRLDELREIRLGGLQTFSEFMLRRMEPAMKTCTYTASRQTALSKRVSRVASLLRARVEVGLEEQNRDLLASMNKRVQLQLRMQETVEGLSVVAISYYLVGLFGYALKGLKAEGLLPISYETGVALSVPLVAGIVWYSIRKIKKHVLGKPEE